MVSDNLCRSLGYIAVGGSENRIFLLYNSHSIHMEGHDKCFLGIVWWKAVSNTATIGTPGIAFLAGTDSD